MVKVRLLTFSGSIIFLPGGSKVVNFSYRKYFSLCSLLLLALFFSNKMQNYFYEAIRYRRHTFKIFFLALTILLLKLCLFYENSTMDNNFGTKHVIQTENGSNIMERSTVKKDLLPIFK